ncbi:hypothetical protein ACH4RG_23160 [Streptomyces sp. NPDC021019]|uniref:hypothetical protein n=1 Tax=Streptomyces sp. NPDC021019 TaxID=3365108 RepID=UPI0037A82A08
MPKIKQRQKMGCLLACFHWTMIVCTIGLWTPVYLGARRKRVTITYLPDNPR